MFGWLLRRMGARKSRPDGQRRGQTQQWLEARGSECSWLGFESWRGHGPSRPAQDGSGDCGVGAAGVPIGCSGGDE